MDKPLKDYITRLEMIADGISDDTQNTIDKSAVNDIRTLISEIETYQTELYTQKEQLENSNKSLENLKDYYSSIFTVIPIGILVIDRKGMIRNQNTAGDHLLQDAFPFSYINSLFQFLTFESGQSLYEAMAITSKKGITLDLQLNFNTEEHRIYDAQLTVMNNSDNLFVLILNEFFEQSKDANAQNLLAQLQQRSPEVVFILDNDCKLVSKNKNYDDFAEKFNLGKSKFPLDKLPKRFENAHQGLTNSPDTSEDNFVSTLTSNNRVDCYFFVTIRVFHHQQKTYFGYMMYDVTHILYQENQLSSIYHVFENLNQSLMVVDDKINVLFVNRSFSRLSGFSLEELQHKDILKWFLNDSRFENQNHVMKTVYHEHHWEGEQTFITKDNIAIPVTCDISSFSGPLSLTRYVILFNDIRETKKSMQRFEDLAYLDELTRVGNRHSFQKLSAEFIRTNATFSMLMMDLDLFKNVNDEHGHQVGDILLKAVVDRTLNLLRKDDQLFRLGGDEFVLIIDTIEHQIISDLSHRLIRTLQKPFKIQGHTIKISCSIGIASYPQHGDTIDDILKTADTALYKAKSSGKGLAVFSH